MDAAERNDPRDAASGADDHLAAYLFTQDAVRRAHVPCHLRGHRRRLEAEPVGADRACRFVDDLVLGCPPIFERQVEPRQCELEADHVRLQHPERLLEQFLPGLVAFENDDRS